MGNGDRCHQELVPTTDAMEGRFDAQQTAVETAFLALLRFEKASASIAASLATRPRID